MNDESGLLMGHITMWSLTDIRNMTRCIQVSFLVEQASRIDPYAAKEEEDRKMEESKGRECS